MYCMATTTVSPAQAQAADRMPVHGIDHVELYSCFPAAVRVQQRELGIPLSRRVTQTGGMTFGGGPLNNFVIQSWVKMVERLREDQGSRGLVTAVRFPAQKENRSPTHKLRMSSTTR